MDHCALVKCNKRNAERFHTLEEITSLLVVVYVVIAKKERKNERQKRDVLESWRYSGYSAGSS